MGKQIANQLLFIYFYISPAILVFIGFNFKPILSGEKSSGEMQDGLKGLLGLTLNLDGLYRPYPMRKYSIGINIAWGCSSVTIDPHAWTCSSKQTDVNYSSFWYSDLKYQEIELFTYLN